MAPIEKGEPGYENRFRYRPIPGGRDLSCYGFLNFIPLPPPGGIAGQVWAPFMSCITCG